MAKKNSFILTKHEPFTIVGNTEHKIPPLEDLSYEDWKGVAALRNGTDTKRIIEAYKAFFEAVCPELKDEPIGDNQWIMIGKSYFDYMGES